MIQFKNGLFKDVAIPVLFEGKWEEVRIEDLASPVWENRIYQVIAWTGRSFKQVEAHSAYPLKPETQLVKMEFSNSKRVICGIGQPISEYVQGSSLQRRIPTSVGLLLTQASGLKCGSGLCSISETGIHKAFHNLAGIQNLSYLRVSKFKVKSCEEPEILYGLQVPSYRNVLLSCGIIVQVD